MFIEWGEWMATGVQCAQMNEVMSARNVAVLLRHMELELSG